MNSINGWRVVLWILSVLSLVLLVKLGHESLGKEGILNWEFVGFVLSNMAFTECIRADERLKSDS
jgi:hypothetical protein